VPKGSAGSPVSENTLLLGSSVNRGNPSHLLHFWEILRWGQCFWRTLYDGNMTILVDGSEGASQRNPCKHQGSDDGDSRDDEIQSLSEGCVRWHPVRPSPLTGAAPNEIYRSAYINLSFGQCCPVAAGL
jgi:hypothetical protein